MLSDENNANLFRAWAENPASKNQGVTDFANLKRNIQPKVEKIETEKSETLSSDSGESETETQATIAKPSIEDIAKELISKMGKKEAIKLSAILWELCDDELSDEDLENAIAS